jgi:CCR4-NOT transcription complex subunit 7/8
MGEFTTKASYHYQTVRCNVDILKLIQLGITLFNDEGEVPPPQSESSLLPMGGYQNSMMISPCTWQFNFQFNLEDDMYNEESIQLLKKSGTDFNKHATQGIDIEEFGSLLTTSGLTFFDEVKWISFHSGYDFAYLAKVIWNQQLPNNEEQYKLDLVEKYFPRIIDIKFLLRHAQKLRQRGVLTSTATSIIDNLGQRSGLQDLADELGCQRVGTQHTAGSDAWLTGIVFFAMKNKIFDGAFPDELWGQMWGLTGVGPPASATTQAAVLAAQGHSANANGMAAGLGGMTFTPGGTREGPSTPTNNAAALSANTPGPGQTQYHGMGAQTPGGYTPFGFPK